jgi:hypothetical protein
MTMAMLSGARRLGWLAGSLIAFGLAGPAGVTPDARAEAPPAAAAATTTAAGEGAAPAAKAPKAKPRPRKRQGKPGKPAATLPAAPEQVAAAAPAAAPPLVELEQAPPAPTPACQVPLRQPTYANDWVQAGVVSLRFPLPPGRPLRKVRPELRFQQQTTEVDLAACYRQYLAERTPARDAHR